MAIKIKMDGEKQRYTVQSFNKRFAVMTKPFNAKKTYLYTITDLDRNVRGRCNLIFGLPCHVNTPEGAKKALEMLERGEMEVTYRTYKCLEDSEIKQLQSLEQLL